MLLYRIVLSKWAHSLQASGRAARWNSKGVEILYFAQSASLACLENAVHLSSVDIYAGTFSKITVKAPDNCLEIKETDLPKGWNAISPMAFSICRYIGDTWIKNNKSAILKVPSVIIPGEYNYLVNPNHSSFKTIKIINVDSFLFDNRLKE